MLFFLRRDEFGEKMRRGKDSSERWQLFQTHFKQFSVKIFNNFFFFYFLLIFRFRFLKQSKKVKLSQYLIEEIMFQYCYPRLDAEVTKGMHHLLKSPFCIHPKTGELLKKLQFISSFQ